MKLTREFAIFLALLVLVALLPVFGAYPVFVMKVMCFALFACAFNLLIGYTGLLSFGHAAFLGVAAYAAGHALKVWGVPTEVGLLVGTLAGAALGFVMGALAIRRSGIYFSMITLALAQMLYFLFLQAPFTGGEDGLQSVPRGTLLGFIDLTKDLTLYYVDPGHLRALVLAHLSDRAFAIRSGTESDPRKRTARHLAGLRRRALQVACVCVVGCAGGIGGCKQDAGARFCHVDRCPLDHVRAGDPDGARGWDGHDARTDPGCLHCGCARKQGR